MENVVVTQTTGKPESYVPIEAIEESEKQRKEKGSIDNPPRGTGKGRKSDPFSEERMAKNLPPIDSSEEALGG